MTARRIVTVLTIVLLAFAIAVGYRVVTTSPGTGTPNCKIEACPSVTPFPPPWNSCEVSECLQNTQR